MITISRYLETPPGDVVDCLDDSLFELTAQFQRQMQEDDLEGALYTLISQTAVLEKVVRFLLCRDEGENILDTIRDHAHISKNHG